MTSFKVYLRCFFSNSIHNLLEYLIVVSQVTVVRSRDKLENVLRHYLIEDRAGNGIASYVDYLCHLHKEIRALLS